jgi:hypothetical protein
MHTYHLIPENKKQDLEKILKKISDYLLSFVGDIIVIKNEELRIKNYESITISYTNASFTARAEITDNKIILTTFDDDSVTINLIKNVASSGGFRIYNTKGYFLPNDSKLMDTSAIGIDRKIFEIFKNASLTPLFQYQNTLIFFCLNKKGEVVMINRHYLEFLITNPQSPISKELSKKVADNTSQFIAMFDRGLISLTFDTLDINKVGKDTVLQVTNFKLDNEKQRFIQTNTTDKIEDKNYLYLKIGQDYSYKLVDNKLYKLINIFVFYDY